MSSSLSARTLDTDPTGDLPCMKDPDGWDIANAEDRSELPVIRHRVIAALEICSTCPVLRWCATQARRNPPGHACVQGGLIWAGAGTSKRARRAAWPVPYKDWKPTLIPFPDAGVTTSPSESEAGADRRDPRCGTEAGASAHRRRSEPPCEPCQTARQAAKRDRDRRAGLPSRQVDQHNVSMAVTGYPPAKLTKGEQRAVAARLIERGHPIPIVHMAARMRCTPRTVHRIVAELKRQADQQETPVARDNHVDTVAVRQVVDGTAPFADLNGAEQAAVVAAMLAKGYSRSAISARCHIGWPRLGELVGQEAA